MIEGFYEKTLNLWLSGAFGLVAIAFAASAQDQLGSSSVVALRVLILLVTGCAVVVDYTVKQFNELLCPLLDVE